MISNTKNALQLTLFQFGVAICLPSMMAGYFLCKQYGLMCAVSSMIIGSLILFALSIIPAIIASQSHLSINDIMGLYLNKQCKVLFSIAILSACSGWFGFQLDLMSEAATKSILTFAPNIANEEALRGVIIIVLGIIIAMSVAYGVSGMVVISNITTPIILILMLYSSYNAYNTGKYTPIDSSHMFSVKAIMVIISAQIMSLVVIQNVYRFSKGVLHSLPSLFLSYFTGNLIIKSAGIILALYAVNATFLGSMNENSSELYANVFVLFVVISGWTTNNANLYHSSCSLMSVSSHRITFKASNIICGVFGVLAALMHPASHFFTFLDIIGVTISSSFVVLVSNFAISGFKVQDISKENKMISSFIFASSFCFGVMSMFGVVNLTGIPPLDTILICLSLFFIYFSYKKLIHRNICPNNALHG